MIKTRSVVRAIRSSTRPIRRKRPEADRVISGSGCLDGGEGNTQIARDFEIAREWKFKKPKLSFQVDRGVRQLGRGPAAEFEAQGLRFVSALQLDVDFMAGFGKAQRRSISFAAGRPIHGRQMPQAIEGLLGRKRINEVPGTGSGS